MQMIASVSILSGYFSRANFKHVFCRLQSLPRIDLANYSALPVDEGDEDREAGIGDEEDGDSDLDLGDDPADEGKPVGITLYSPDGRISDEQCYKFCFVFSLRRGEGRHVHPAVRPPTLLSAGPRAAG